ncbi:unnamed protein product [Orchesella dallaii]|uniref:Phospholipid scramblase n=1 Tax=Orchesella dallaii TaxID=48710 RepID=A0ABP1Q0C1_9HEXA
MASYSTPSFNSADEVVLEQSSSQPSQQSQPQHRKPNLSLSPGLEYLISTRGLIIQQQIEWGEIMLGVNFNNRYHIVDDLAENSDPCSLFCMGSRRPWNILLFDQGGNAVMQGKRTSCCCFGLYSNVSPSFETCVGLIFKYNYID